MSLDAIEKVAAAEEATRQRRAEGQAEARKILADGERAGEARRQEKRAQALEEGKKLMRQAQERADVQARAVMDETDKACQAMRKAALAHMDEAAALIVRRVVNS